MSRTSWTEISAPAGAELEADEIEHVQELGSSGRLWPLVALFWGGLLVLSLWAGLFGVSGDFSTRNLAFDFGSELLLVPIPLIMLFKNLKARGEPYDFYLFPDRVVRARHGTFEVVDRDNIGRVYHSWTWRPGARQLMIITDRFASLSVFLAPVISRADAEKIERWFHG